MKIYSKVFCTILLILLNVQTALAEESQVLMQQLAELKEKVSSLEAQIKHDPTIIEAPNNKEVTVKNFFEEVEVGAMVDSIYSYNFNSPTDSTNIARVFDNESNNFDINAAELTFQKSVSPESPAGFRMDVIAGTDAKLIHSAGLGNSDDSFDLQQAYGEINIQASKLNDGINDINLKVGKFVTLAGAEVIESKDNWNTSRSLMFGYAIPFTHTGARASYTFDNSWDLILGINNGWDVAEDNNSAKSFEAHFGFNNMAVTDDSSLSLIFQGVFGPEQEDDNASDRSLGDFIAIYKTPWKPLTLMYNFDYATQENFNEDGSNADWYGHAGYARVNLAEDWSISGRAEYFDDCDGARIVSDVAAQYTAFTATLEYRPWEKIITRLEYRYDHASESVFNDSNSQYSDSQATTSAEIIFVL